MQGVSRTGEKGRKKCTTSPQPVHNFFTSLGYHEYEISRKETV